MSAQQLIITEENFLPPAWARNCHTQSLLGTLKFRKPILLKKSKDLLAQSRELILEAHDDIRLQSFYSPQTNPSNKLVILLHGWEGSHESLYLLSAANSLFQAGYDVLRLNLRDHGTSHHLNQELFHSNRLQEVIEAIKSAQDKLNPTSIDMVGFSLGGNFTCRVAVEAPQNNIKLQKAVAICPAINPIDILHQLESGLSFYHDYFVKKWKRSLRKKENYFPGAYDFSDIYPMKSMRVMTERLLELFGDYESPEDYFNGYSLSGKRMASLEVPTTILMTKDDPVINYQDTFSLVQNSYLKIHASQYGGHCGFIKNAKLQSWADDFILSQID
ncbi:MAG: alpha/beta fold hydrolase [Gammaproteobacteria bacterium]|nr:alpha/beta fold hydrolase [Gammaproteobacteria bacterium]